MKKEHYGALVFVLIIGVLLMSWGVHRPDSVMDRILHPGYGHCGKCGMTWASVTNHITWYSTNGNGIFVLCEDCWKSLTPHERLPYYRGKWEEWGRDDFPDAQWADIERAVLEGR